MSAFKCPVCLRSSNCLIAGVCERCFNLLHSLGWFTQRELERGIEKAAKTTADAMLAATQEAFAESLASMRPYLPPPNKEEPR